MRELRRRRAASAKQAEAASAVGIRQSGDLIFELFDEQNLCLIGTPDKLVAKLRRIEELYGQPDLLLLEVAQGGLPPAEVIPMLEMFAREVTPSFDRG